MPDYSGCQASASIRQWSDRCVVVAKEGVTSEDPMPFSEVTVEPEVGLILMVGFGGGPDKVIRAGDVRQRVVLKDLEPNGVETSGGNRVVRKLRARRTCRIEDRLHKDPLPLR